MSLSFCLFVCLFVWGVLFDKKARYTLVCFSVEMKVSRFSSAPCVVIVTVFIVVVVVVVVGGGGGGWASLLERCLFWSRNIADNRLNEINSQQNVFVFGLL